VIWRALAVWLLILVLANLNGFLREAWLVPPLGDQVGRAVSTIALSGLVLLVTWLSIRWIGPRRWGEAMKIGVFWLLLTLAFEFLVGRYVLAKPWPVLLEDYDLSRGRIWIIVLLVVLLAPPWTARIRGIFSGRN
jgi:hypothetical protein